MNQNCKNISNHKFIKNAIEALLKIYTNLNYQTISQLTENDIDIAHLYSFYWYNGELCIHRNELQITSFYDGCCVLNICVLLEINPMYSKDLRFTYEPSKRYLIGNYDSERLLRQLQGELVSATERLDLATSILKGN